MLTRRHRLPISVKTLAGMTFAASLLGSPVAVGQPTPADELVMYGIDADTHELLRYAFDTNTFKRIGVVVDQNGFVVDHPECLTYVPSGPDRGFYCVPSGKDSTGGPEFVLMKIFGFDASAEAYPNPIGFERIHGMVSKYNAGAGKWEIIAFAETPSLCLISIDPATGIGTKIMDVNEKYEGLALHVDPTKLWGVEKHTFWEIDLVTGVETEMADLSAWERIEAFETAFGDNGPAITIPGVDPTWTQNGALFFYSDSENELLVLNPANGDNEIYTPTVNPPCAFLTVDCEGLVFFTQLTDPYGKILVDAHD
jgi:hypothetical protein